MLAIKNATLVMRDHYIENGVVLTENGVITAFGSAKDTPIPQGAEVIDAQGKYVGPGFVDIHTHAGDNVVFHENPVKAATFHLSHGTTSVLPALYTTMTTQVYVEAAGILRKAMQTEECANIAGFYMEGPYLNPDFGADRTSNPWADGVKKEAYQPVIDAAWDLAKAWCVAPEREGILEFVKDVRAKNPNAVFTVAHSAASPQQIEALMPYGLRIATHHTNATGDRPMYPECRGVCVDETVNYNREIYAELICDKMGIHVDPYMLRLVRRIKGEDRLILISDTYIGTGAVPPGYDGADDINFDDQAEIAGTKLSLDACCRNMMKHTGASVCDVFRYASYNPSRAVNLLDRGEIAVGNRADLVICDHQINISKVILKGKVR